MRLCGVRARHLPHRAHHALAPSHLFHPFAPGCAFTMSAQLRQISSTLINQPNSQNSENEKRSTFTPLIISRISTLVISVAICAAILYSIRLSCVP
ncbi:hypothetical protein L228DRAFT_94768 [Xylona heveae TC161]|uniref:Uncharacterized protein n=1 Tax=Xylona heveae (strain CBS 132557 / TC161) TaxID=1328760 RepID=A0A161TEG9_XYLHT|nr:hypothetical protein L228DRAFT_94768 [Xylona heveae TC161]KZF24337.1 hypothetical protein L228DRAFT_94768 [Xylona heveae TC161]